MGAHQLDRPAFVAAHDGLCAASIALGALESGDAGPARAAIARWLEVHTSGNPDSVRRYPWPINTAYYQLPPYVPPRTTWHAWRPAEEEWRQRDIGRFEASLLGPLVRSDAVALLDRLAEDGEGDAAALLERVLPVVRRDMARLVVGQHAWSDTWGLWNLARHEGTLRRLHPFALAVADTYAARAVAQGSVGTGSRFPFHDRPLVSVSAQLAAGLVALGFHPQLTGRLAAWVAAREAADGAWGDADGPADLLTTLVAADLLAGLDPAWDAAPTLAWIERQRRADGAFVAYGPEAAWLTLELDALARRLARPFRSASAGRTSRPSSATGARSCRSWATSPTSRASSPRCQPSPGHRSRSPSSTWPASAPGTTATAWRPATRCSASSRPSSPACPDRSRSGTAETSSWWSGCRTGPGSPPRSRRSGAPFRAVCGPASGPRRWPRASSSGAPSVRPSSMPATNSAGRSPRSRPRIPARRRRGSWCPRPALEAARDGRTWRADALARLRSSGGDRASELVVDQQLGHHFGLTRL